MDTDRKKLIFYIIASAMIFSLFTTFYWSVNVKPELDERDRNDFIPGAWIPEFVRAYNDSESIEFLECHFPGEVGINNKSRLVRKLIIIAIPDDMENRASFGVQTFNYTLEDENIIVGNNTKIITSELNVAYVFVDVKVSNALYDRYKEFNHPAMGPSDIEVVCIDLTSAPFRDNSTHRELLCNDDGGVIGVTETTTTEGVGVHKVGIRTTDKNITINPDNVSF